MIDLFKRVETNIPLLDAIKQIPAYAMFLKDLCTQKQKFKVQKKAFLAEQVSSIIQNNIPPKFKDPDCPTISCVIGNHVIDKALLDLRASVNVLSHPVYKQLGLGKMKSTQIRLSLADRSVKYPRGIVEDVLIKIDKFIFLVDIIILDTEPVSNPSNYVPEILGRPFLATANEVIHCQNEIMKISFDNMTVELNVFDVSK